MAFLRIPRRPDSIDQRLEKARKSLRQVEVPDGLDVKGTAVNLLPGNRMKPVPVFTRRRREIGHDDV